MILIREILVCVLGLLFGSGTAAGVLGLLSSLGVIPRIVGKSSTAKHILLCEDFLLVGAGLGSFFAILELDISFLGIWFLVIVGIFTGIFVGCLAAALAEVIQIWPILYRRSNTKYGVNISMTCFAIGKLVGALFFFIRIKYLV